MITNPQEVLIKNLGFLKVTRKPTQSNSRSLGKRTSNPFTEDSSTAIKRRLQEIMSPTQLTHDLESDVTPISQIAANFRIPLKAKLKAMIVDSLENPAFNSREEGRIDIAALRKRASRFPVSTTRPPDLPQEFIGDGLFTNFNLSHRCRLTFRARGVSQSLAPATEFIAVLRCWPSGIFLGNHFKHCDTWSWLPHRLRRRGRFLLVGLAP
jgi:hypothetical protein